MQKNILDIIAERFLVNNKKAKNLYQQFEKAIENPNYLDTIEGAIIKLLSWEEYKIRLSRDKNWSHNYKYFFLKELNLFYFITELDWDIPAKNNFFIKWKSRSKRVKWIIKIKKK